MEQNTFEKKRIEWLDICRSIAIASVVLCHSVQSMYPFEQNYIVAVTIKRQIFMFTVFTFGRLGVPLFLFISGYLLLRDERKNAAEECISFWKKRLGGLLFTTEIWIVIYNIFLWWYRNEVSLQNLILNMLFLKSVEMSHMWYMPMIIGVYFFIPFLSNLVIVFSKKIWIVVGTVLYLYNFCGVFVDIVSQIKWGISLQLTAPTFIGGCYGLYLVCGYFIKKGLFRKINNKYLIFVAILSFVFTIAFQIYTYKKEVGYTVWYDFPTLLICALAIFVLFSKSSFNNRILLTIGKSISRCAFGIYLVHNLIIEIIRKYIDISYYSSPIHLLILWLFIFGLSYLIIQIASKNKYIGHYLFWMK